MFSRFRCFCSEQATIIVRIMGIHHMVVGMQNKEKCLGIYMVFFVSEDVEKRFTGREACDECV